MNERSTSFEGLRCLPGPLDGNLDHHATHRGNPCPDNYSCFTRNAAHVPAPAQRPAHSSTIVWREDDLEVFRFA
jgi:hypothetical protein